MSPPNEPVPGNDGIGVASVFLTLQGAIRCVSVHCRWAMSTRDKWTVWPPGCDHLL